ncbi:MAG TPA: hypothetical protein VGF01_04975, partial [Terracidiphilus sp.]
MLHDERRCDADDAGIQQAPAEVGPTRRRVLLPQSLGILAFAVLFLALIFRQTTTAQKNSLAGDTAATELPLATDLS